MRNVDPQEWEVRCDLAAAYRLIAHYGMDDLIYTHLSARLPGRDHRFLLNPYGLMFDEITASSLSPSIPTAMRSRRRTSRRSTTPASPSIPPCT
jgi:hypothetical protein